MKLGFIGTGAIAEAVIRGLFNHGNYTQTICVSKRSVERSEKLAQDFSLVDVFDDSQKLIDACDCVVLAVLPEQMQPLIGQLRFRDDHTILSLAATLTISTISEALNSANAPGKIYRALPMPPVEYGLGPTPVFPANEEIEFLFNSIGVSIAVEQEEHFDVFAAASAFMAPFFELLAGNARWMESKSVSKKAAAQYSTTVAQALATLAVKAVQTDEHNLQKLSQECQTTGGLNEQTFNGCKTTGWFEVMPKQFDDVLVRLKS